MAGQVDKGWWTPGEIVFTRRQMEWLISYLPTLEVGLWPPIPQGDSFSRHSGRPGAPFETPAQIYAEVTHRLDRCGQDGELLKDVYLWQKTDRELEVTYRDDVGSIYTRIRRTLKFCSGFSRKRCSYGEWVAAGWRVPYHIRRKPKHVESHS